MHSFYVRRLCMSCCATGEGTLTCEEHRATMPQLVARHTATPMQLAFASSVVL
jgi:hypothetical protein